MRSLRDFNRCKFLNKWVKQDIWRNTFKCVGESDEFIYIWWDNNVHEYPIYSDFIIGNINIDTCYGYHSYVEVRDFRAKYNTCYAGVKWIR